MLELTCAFLLVSASLVLATPHGYLGHGVKGGASARAEASASAGAFGGVPVPVPLGAGYSGSFSKSSSSSSASSSASSSSSSFSYSGSGAGVNGFGLNGGTPNHGGCSTGNCHTAGNNGIPSPHGAFPQVYNSANAAASAEAVPELGCQGLSCVDNSDKCKSGSCKSKPHSGTPSTNSDPKKCTSGQCGSVYDIGATSTDYDSNDIRAVSGSSRNVNDQNTGNVAGSDCSHGKCGSLGSSNSKPNDYGHDLGNYYQGSSANNKQKGSSFDTGISFQYQKPSSHLETPKLGSKCTSGNCYGSAEPGHETSPSSYNVPIHEAYDKGIPKPSCDGVKCENQPKEPHSPTDNIGQKEPSSFDHTSATNCGGTSCFGIPTNQATDRPTLGVTSCNSPNCNPYPTNPAGSIAAPGHTGHGKPGDVNKVSNDKRPVYTGGFGGPAGVLNPNENNFSPPTGNPSHGPISTHNGKPLEGSPTGCNTPSCPGYPSASRPTGGSVPEGTYNHHTGGKPSEKLPTYPGGFGGPSGILNPNEGVHGTVTNNPNYAHNGRPSYNTQPPAANTGTLGCKVGENCVGYTPTKDDSSGVTVPSGYYGSTTHTNVGNIHYSHGPALSSPGYTPTETFNTPNSSGHPEGCKTSNCYSSFGSTAAPHAQAESFGVTKPSSGSHLSSVTLPALINVYDRPSGVHKPSDVAGLVSTPSSAHSQPPHSPGSYSTGCKTGNCANGSASSNPAASGATANAQSGSGVHGFSGISGPASTPSFTHSQPPYSPGSFSTGCKTGNCAINGLTSGPSAGANAQSGYGVHGSSDVSGPASTPSFTHSQPPHSPGSYSTGCKTGNCANGPASGSSAGANAQSGSGVYGFSGISGPASTPSFTHSQPPYSPGSYSTGCKTGNCAINGLTSGPSAGSNAQSVYGVHGSSEVSGPASTPSFTHSQPPYSPGSFSSACQTGNCANGPTTGPSAGANAQSGSGIYGSSGVTGPASTPRSTHSQPPYSPGSYSAGCKTGNCVNGPTSGPSAGANAQSGSGIHGSSDVSGPASTPSFTHSQPPYSPGSYSPACQTGNCANGPTTGPSAGANAQSESGVYGSSGVTGPASTPSSTHSQPPYSPGSYSAGCKTGNCVNGPTSGPSAGANAQSGSGIHVSSGDSGPASTPSFAHSQPPYSPGSYSTDCKTGNCANSPTSGPSAGANLGSAGVPKPSNGNYPSNEKPLYTGGFGGAAGLLKPDEYTIPATNPKPNNKPTGLPTNAACTSGNCDTQLPHSSASHSSNAVSGAHVTAAAAAEANAVVYSGGFGGPPGVLAPYDNGKLGTLPTNGKQGHGSQTGGAHGSHNTIHSQHVMIPVADGEPSGPARGHGNTAAQAGSLTGATAYAGAAAGSSASAHGYNPQGSHYSHEGNIKGPCAGECGGSGDGAHSGGSGSSSGAAAKSLSGANAFGVGGSYASSSASAHASAGVYTKGGYGKR